MKLTPGRLRRAGIPDESLSGIPSGTHQMADRDMESLVKRANRIKTHLWREWFPSAGGDTPSNRVVAEECVARAGWDLTASKGNAAYLLCRYWDDFHARQSIPLSKTQQKKRAARRSAPASLPNFYLTREWLQTRYKALLSCGAKCVCCGATAASSGRALHVDHIKPRSKYPELELEVSNLQVLCHDCNMGKGAWDQTDWRGPVKETLQ